MIERFSSVFVFSGFDSEYLSRKLLFLICTSFMGLALHLIGSWRAQHILDLYYIVVTTFAKLLPLLRSQQWAKQSNRNDYSGYLKNVHFHICLPFLQVYGCTTCDVFSLWDNHLIDDLTLPRLGYTIWAVWYHLLIQKPFGMVSLVHPLSLCFIEEEVWRFWVVALPVSYRNTNYPSWRSFREECEINECLSQ